MKGKDELFLYKVLSKKKHHSSELVNTTTVNRFPNHHRSNTPRGKLGLNPDPRCGKSQTENKDVLLAAMALTALPMGVRGTFEWHQILSRLAGQSLVMFRLSADRRETRHPENKVSDS